RAELSATLTFLGVLSGETRNEIRGAGATAKLDEAEIARLIEKRLAARAEKDFATSDTIRDTLAAQGIRLKDGKDPATGQPATTWEMDD
ncbi:MAG: cysteine--tRNA ligase, partial [Pseudomonadota bacterium]